MAITINSEPGTLLLPAYNPIQYLASSDETAQANYKMEVRVYTDLDSGGRLVDTTRNDKKPNLTKVLASVHSVIQSEIIEDTTYVQASTNGIQEETGNVKDFQIQFQDFYGDIPQATGTTVSGNTISVVNAAFRYMDWVANTGLNNWSVISGLLSPVMLQSWLSPFENTTDNATGLSTDLVLTPEDNYYPLRYDQLLPLRIRHTGTSARILYQTYDSELNVNQSAVMQASGMSSSNKILMVMLNNDVLDSNTYISGGITLTDDDKYLSVIYTDTANSRNSVARLYELQADDCSRFEKFEIHWLNHMGGWDSYVFDGKSQHFQDVERNDFQRLTTEIDGNTIVNSISARKTGRYYTSLKDRYMVRSQNVPEWIIAGMADLFGSSLVFWRHPTIGFIQIKNMASNEYRYWKETDRIFSVEFGFEIDHDNIVQRA